MKNHGVHKKSQWLKKGMITNLRFVISASFVACAGLIGVLAFLPATLEERLASAEDSIGPATSKTGGISIETACRGAVCRG